MKNYLKFWRKNMQNKILDEYKKAVKENDFWRKKVLTTLRSEIKNLEIMLRPKI